MNASRASGALSSSSELYSASEGPFCTNVESAPAVFHWLPLSATVWKMPGLPLPGFSPPDFHRLGFPARILAPGFSPPGFPHPDSRPWILTAWVFPTRILAAGVFTARVFLRDGQIHGVGAVVQRHIEEGRPETAAANWPSMPPSEVRMR